MEIHISGDNSVVMEFNSDSEDDEDDILRDLMSHHGHQNTSKNRNRTQERKFVHVDERVPVSGKSMKQSSSSDHGSIFSESDEDFCLVDAPTITKVVSEYTVHDLVKSLGSGLCSRQQFTCCSTILFAQFLAFCCYIVLWL